MKISLVKILNVLTIYSIFFLFSCLSKNETIKIKGSDTEVNLAVQFAEEFHKKDSEVLISISGGGSGLGIASLLNGNADIANSSRSIKETELALFRKKDIELDSVIFAQDAIAFIVSDKIPMDSISVQNIAKVLSGEYLNWSSLIFKDFPITIYGRQSNSGTYDYVKQILGIHFSPYSKQMNGNAQIIEAIKADGSGFGYVGAGYVMKDNIKGIKILKVFSNKSNAISPLDSKKIASGEYFFQRPLFQYFKRKDFERIKSFLEFEKSTTGAKIIQASGYYPIIKL